MQPLNILFVDDEPSVRMTLPAILRQLGFHVTAAATVAEALTLIGSFKFDVLISDLNIGHPGDGFAVVSAMRRTQPECVNFILTGYPAFESALQTIRNHVDDYLIKPADVNSLVGAIEEKLCNRTPRGISLLKHIAVVLRENADQICATAVKAMKAHPQIGALPLSDDERLQPLPDLLACIIERLESSSSTDVAPPQLLSAESYGRLRRQQGYSIPMIVEDTRLLDHAISDTIQENLLSLDVSNLIMDLRRINDTLEFQLRESLQSYLSAEQPDRKVA